MSTTSGTMKSFKVTDKDGNVYIMTLVDTVAQQAINEAKNLQFDDDFFTSEVSQDNTTVNVGLNGVPLGVDSDSPLKFVQDNAQGIVFGSDAPFATAIAPAYSPSSTYRLNAYCTYLGKLYRCSTAINTAEAWTAAHWTEVDTISSQSVKVYTFSGTSYPDADEIRNEKDKGKIIVLKKHTAGGSAEADQYYYLDVYGAGPGIPAGTGVQMDFYPVDNSRKFIRAFKDTTQSSPVWVWSQEDTNVTNTIGSIKNGGVLTDAASVNVPNNALSTLATAQASLTLNVNVGANEVPNFAVEVTPSVDVTLTVTKTVNSTATELSPSVSGGNSLTSGKKYQVTCVGSCWTLAEFTVPTP